MPQYKTRQEQAFAEAAKKRKAERKNAPMTTAQIDGFLIGQARKIGLLDGYQGKLEMGEDLVKHIFNNMGK